MVNDWKFGLFCLQDGLIDGKDVRWWHTMQCNKLKENDERWSFPGLRKVQVAEDFMSTRFKRSNWMFLAGRRNDRYN